MSGTARATALIAAAGSGERLGAGGPKALAEVGGRPMVEWSIEACRGASSIASIVVAAPAGHVHELGGGDLAVVEGGASRAESVARALGAVGTGIVVVHDAARPLVEPGLIDAAVAELDGRGELDGVIAARPLTDTVKWAGEDRIVDRTLDRDRLWAAQTPQAFRTAALREAHAAGDAGGATDDAMLVERAGGRIALLEGPPENLKVTTPLDLRLAGLLLAER